MSNGSVNKTAKEHAKKGVVFLWAFGCALVFGVIDCLEAVLHAQHLSDVPPSQWARTAIFAIVGVLVGLLVDLMLESRRQLKSVSVEVDESRKLVAALKPLLRPFNEMSILLEESKQHKPLVEQLFVKAMEFLFLMPRCEQGVFYRLLMQGIQHATNTWEGIHHTEIEKLVRDDKDKDSLAYFNLLGHRSSCLERAHRIIITTEADRERLNDRDFVEQLIENTVGSVRSFAIDEEDVRAYFKDPTIRFDDCALHDRAILMHYDRKDELITVGFGYPGQDEKLPRQQLLPRVTDLFEQLDLFLDPSHDGDCLIFREIRSLDGDGMDGDESHASPVAVPSGASPLAAAGVQQKPAPPKQPAKHLTGEQIEEFVEAALRKDNSLSAEQIKKKADAVGINIGDRRLKRILSKMPHLRKKPH
jgi:hypothetical protein